ncbi:hypothetical protein ASE63_19015 [Bosea sp. Root381]|uniref:hypothetical protein n=1 Tax=Bosea sp. Root381 TaxID=1736524 RepID=UPI0006FA6863|nr:hypothetical protein [Bosea sp. Root381]KRE11847.1 hypothetical protein ASE63_19015 [Bosea sp. Root381]
MIVSQNRAANLIPLLPGSGDPACPTPFWELEELIESGLERDQALGVMSVRRGEKPSTQEVEATAAPAQQGGELVAGP